MLYCVDPSMRCTGKVVFVLLGHPQKGLGNQLLGMVWHPEVNTLLPKQCFNVQEGPLEAGAHAGQASPSRYR